MWKRFVAISAILLLASASVASAQKVEVSGLFGWTISDGVTGDARLAADGGIYDAVDVKDSASWGLAFGVNATDNVEVGLLFGQQMTTLSVQGSRTRDLGDLTVTTYHPYLAFNMGERDASVRPYVMVGIGATNYGGVDYTAANGKPGQTSSKTQFSGTIGAGVKVFPSPNFGVRAGFQWTPTYIKTDETGWWCDPYWGCYVVGNAQYANQLQFNGGITLRF